MFDKRIHEIDFFRGILIILVILDHLLWFINFYIFHRTSGFLNWYWSSELRAVVRQIVLMAFLFTCGISCYFSRNNKKRGTLLLLLCIGVTIVTHLANLLPIFASRGSVAIDFNILGVIALSILTFCVFESRSDKDLWIVTAILMLIYFFIIVSLRVSQNTEYNPFRSILYLEFNPVRNGYVSDYLPLFPYIVFLFLGILFARKFYNNKTSLIKNKKNWERPICFLGRHTLIIYIAHEVIFTGLFMLIALAI